MMEALTAAGAVDNLLCMRIRGAAFRSVAAYAVGACVLISLPACVKKESQDQSGGPAAAAPSASAVQAKLVATPEATVARVEVTPGLERSCREICDRSRRLNCQNVAKCMPNCLAMGSLTPCSDPISSFYRCLVSQPIQNWKCGPDGVAEIQSGFCDEEQGKTVACMEAKMQ